MEQHRTIYCQTCGKNLHELNDDDRDSHIEHHKNGINLTQEGRQWYEKNILANKKAPLLMIQSKVSA